MALRIDILGNGVAARLCALYLTEPARRWPVPLKVRLYDKVSSNSRFSTAAAKVAAAMLCPLAESAVLPAELVPVAQQSLSLWQQLRQQLPGLWLQQQGCILLSHPQQQQQLQQQVRQLTSGAQALDAAQLSALEPALSGRFNRAWLCPQDGQTDSHSFLQHSQTVLQQRGVSFCQLAAAECDANQLRRAKANCDLLLDCRGLGAKADWPQLRPVRGEVLRLRCSEISLNRPVRFYHPRYSLYVAPKAAQQFVVGATELESASEQGCTVRSALELLSALYALHPGFAEAEILTLSASARPTLPSPVPQIQQQDGVIALNGLSRHGYLLGPVFARQTAELAQQLLCH
jgi:glycine oxidase